MPASDFLAPTAFVDSDNEAVRAFAQDAAGALPNDKARALALYTAVRDRIVYDPYVDYTDPAVFRASGVLAAGRGFCIGKSAVLAASARALGIAARPGFADVRNHLTSKKLSALTGSDTFRWHAYTELLIEGSWVKCTPAFDGALCVRAGLAPIDFDGVTDSLLHHLRGRPCRCHHGRLPPPLSAARRARPRRRRFPRRSGRLSGARRSAAGFCR
ncbi:MAG: transglutaminase family protein [Pseudolabrys sp.]